MRQRQSWDDMAENVCDKFKVAILLLHDNAHGLKLFQCLLEVFPINIHRSTKDSDKRYIGTNSTQAQAISARPILKARWKERTNLTKEIHRNAKEDPISGEYPSKPYWKIFQCLTSMILWRGSQPFHCRRISAANFTGDLSRRLATLNVATFVQKSHSLPVSSHHRRIIVAPVTLLLTINR